MSTTTSVIQLLGASSMGADGVPERCWEILNGYRSQLLNQALAMVGELQDAEDIVQETFTDAFKDAARLADLDSVGAWLRSLNRANALNRLRERKRSSTRVQRIQREAKARATTGGFSMLELREELAQAIEGLPDLHRTIVVLRAWENLSHEEIARRIKKPVGTIWSLFHDATLMLHDKLKTRLPNPSGSSEGGQP